MLQVTEHILIPEEELHWTFVRSSGPGGQNVNKVASAAQLRFDAAQSPSLPAAVKARLLAMAASQVTGGGEILIDARRFRSQARNRDDAIDRLIELIRRAARPVKVRRATRPTAASRRRRVESKKRRGLAKSLRRRVNDT